MHINLKKAQSLVDKYYEGKLPQTKSGSANGTSRADYYTDIFERLPNDDNGPLDANSELGAVDYVAGDQIGFKYVYDDSMMISGSDYGGRGIYDEFKFDGDLITQLSGHFGDGTGTLAVTTYDRARDTTTESRWDAFDKPGNPDSLELQVEAAPSVLEPIEPLKIDWDSMPPEQAAKKKAFLKDMLSRLDKKS